jgi:ABC-type sugar transport system substrate-binding protein
MDKIFIVGADGGLPARDAARAGELDYSISFCGYATGVLATEVIIGKVAEGKDPAGPTVPIAVIEFTPDTVGDLEAKVADKSC